MKIILNMLTLILVNVSLQGWDKFYNWEGSQQRVQCDSDRVSMDYFNKPIVDGEEYFLQDSYNTKNGTDVTQYVALIKKWDKKKEFYSIQVNTLKRYREYRKDDSDGKGYMAKYNLVLTNASNNNNYGTSYTVWFKEKGYWNEEAVKLMEIQH